MGKLTGRLSLAGGVVILVLGLRAFLYERDLTLAVLGLLICAFAWTSIVKKSRKP